MKIPGHERNEALDCRNYAKEGLKIVNPDMDAINNQLMALGNIYSGRVMILNSSLQVINDTYDIYTGRTMVWQNAILALRGRRSSTYDDDSHCQIIAVPIMGTGAGSTVEGVIVITKSTDYLEQNVSFYTRLLLFSVLVSGILATIVALFSSSYLTDPLRKLSAAILNRQNSGEQVMVSDVVSLDFCTWRLSRRDSTASSIWT